ncbi:MAG: sel1 repeat family protein [Clostridiales bacterium]|nr:sel1 repeat family protein [Clostridiales bacterium]
MKELEWIKELREDFEKGDQAAFPPKEYFKDLECCPPDLIGRQLRQSAERARAGDLDEMWALAEYYALGGEKRKIPRNYEKAIYWYGKAAERKSESRGQALYLLARCYKDARGKNRDYKKAYEMLRALAEIDCSKIKLTEEAEFTADAAVTLAHCYYDGIGTEKNVEKAIAIWKEYAERSIDAACRNLGVEYLSGKHLKRDYEKTFYWTQKAAERGDVVAINNLGWCYEKGYGTRKDINRAVECYRDAANCGNRVAKNNLKRLKKEGVIADEND